MIAQAAPASRYHALDALRAAMMFLGIYLHAAVAYSPDRRLAVQAAAAHHDARLFDRS